MDPSRRRWLIAGLAVGGTAAAATIWRIIATRVPQGIASAIGDVRVNGQPASAGTPVRSGDSVTTGPGGMATFVIDEAAFLLREDGEIEIREDPLATRILTIVSGMLLSVFPPRPVTINTPLATIGIRGTGIFVDSTPERTYVCLCYGQADLASRADPAARETIATTHHEQPRILRPGAGPGTITPATFVINHTDEELILLESLVGRVPPFGNQPVGQY